MEIEDGRSTAATAETGASIFDYHAAANDDASEAFRSSGCCPRIRSEFRSDGPGFFGLAEPSGESIDVEKSFAPPPNKRTLAVRVIFFTATLVTIARRYFITFPKENRFIFFGYLTHWTLVFCALYQIVAAICTSFRGNLHQPESGEDQIPRFMVRLMWGLFALSAPASVIVVVMYWTVDFQPGTSTVTAENVMAHGGVALLVWVDGLIISLIPLRMKQIVFLYIVSILFIVWSVVHDLMGIGDGDWEGEGDDAVEDSLYKSLSWSTNPLKAGVVSAITLFVLVPASFCIFWLLSLWSIWCKFDGSRRPLSTTGADQRRFRKGMV